jgi:hypothetical protein
MLIEMIQRGRMAEQKEYSRNGNNGRRVREKGQNVK